MLQINASISLQYLELYNAIVFNYMFQFLEMYYEYLIVYFTTMCFSVDQKCGIEVGPNHVIVSAKCGKVYR